MSNLNRSLNDLIGRPASEPVLGSHLETAYLAACAKPLGQLTVEELRLLIGQRESLDIIIPLALDYLEHDPLSSGDLFEGDLLATVLRRPAMEFWAARPDLFRRVRRILGSVEGLQLDRELQRDITSFRQRQGA